jgi:hypothetical protein
VDAILSGQRDGSELAKLRDPHIKADTETLQKSLEGNWRREHLFTLGQSRDLYRIYQQQIVNCDLEIEKMLRATGNEIGLEQKGDGRTGIPIQNSIYVSKPTNSSEWM